MNKGIKKIATENPIEEQWKLLLRYGYPANISKFFKEKGFKVDDEIIEFVSGSIMQAHAYFEVANKSSLYIKPLLVYYGVSNLMAGAGTLIKGEKLNIKGHGMKLIAPQNLEKGIATSNIKIVDEKNGAFSNFIKIFFRGLDLPKGTIWELKELFSFIPDLKNDFESCYSGISANVLPIEIVKLRNITIERIHFEDCPNLKENYEIFSRIQDFSKSYLKPQIQEDKVILYRKLNNYEDIGIYSINGRKYLQVSIVKNGKLISIPPLMSMYMGLYALGYLSRYHPNIWNPFIQKDLTGEKLLVEKFLSISMRHIPNLVLNLIEEKNIQFVNETDGITDLRFVTLKSEIEDIISEKIDELLYSEGLKYK
ncbi:YaaC family protein [Geobacillus thermoleovorans]|uniref:YaaC family protein n=1 Tax=Geobacillus thermoleovorans TaxID=33941 RepID=UPI00345BAA2B